MATRKSKSEAKQAFLDQMKDEQSWSSPLGAYIIHLKSMGDEGAAAAEALLEDLSQTFRTEQGLRTLKLMEKSVLLSAQPNGSSDSALRELNAVRNFVLEIRRFVSNG